MRIMITGGTGFIGQHLCRKLNELNELSQNNVEIYATWHTTAPSAELRTEFSNITWLQHDWTLPVIDKLPSIDIVLHLAAAIPSPTCPPFKAGQLNRDMDTSILGYALANRARLVYASSMAVYDSDEQEIAEDSTKITQEPYGLEKFMFEQEAMLKLSEQNIPFVSLRISSPYGIGSTLSTVLPIFVQRALQGKPLLYHGSGNRQQDFVHVSDVTQGFIAGMNSPSGIFHLASGKPVTMRELAITISKLAGLPPQDFVQPSQQPDSDENKPVLYSLNRSASELGWTPKVSLKEGLLSLMPAELAPLAS